MYFLGISGGILPGNQDGAAALVKDGRIVAAVEEERLIGIKHASGLLPKNAIKFCLKKAGITLKDVQSVSFPGKTYKDFNAILTDYLEFHFGYAPPVVLCDHHTAHAASTYFVWGREPALILTMDFSGDRVSTFAAIGRGQEIEEIYRIRKPNSLGIFYSILTQYLGFQKDSDEYKVMGLSSYGSPKYDLSGVLCTNGTTYHLNAEHLQSFEDPDRPAPSKQERLFSGNLTLPENARLADEPVTEYHMDVAASGQKALEDVVLHLIEKLVKQTGIRRLCLAGGVSLNCSMNQKIRESGLLDELFVPPHVSDAGLSIGCALLESTKHKIVPRTLEHGYLGPAYTDAEILQILEDCHATYEKPESVEVRAAKDLAAGKIVGWFQGEMEFGPRALGNRSILADPRDDGMKDKINRLVKFREQFRPFTPSVLAERAEDFFENTVPSPYMTVTFNVKEAKKSVIPAVTHVDGTARIQTVCAQTNEKYHRLIQEFDKITGVPVLLNTSLNVMGQPIACSPRMALATFHSCGMDSLALGPYYLTKKQG